MQDLYHQPQGPLGLPPKPKPSFRPKPEIRNAKPTPKLPNPYCKP